MPAYLSNDRYVLVNPYEPGNGGVFLDSALAVPLEARVCINGAPVVEQSHQLVLKRAPRLHATD